jgi:hypothetical protein
MGDQVRLLGYEQLAARGVGYSRTHIRRLEKRREFPQHVQGRRKRELRTARDAQLQQLSRRGFLKTELEEN